MATRHVSWDPKYNVAYFTSEHGFTQVPMTKPAAQAIAAVIDYEFFESAPGSTLRPEEVK